MKVFLASILGIIIGASCMAIIQIQQASNLPFITPTPVAEQLPTSSGHTDHEGKSMTMNDMVSILEGKKDDEYDKAFLEGMIEHHQGAIDMSKNAEVSAKHDEIKKLARDIIEAQTNEIAQMKQWQKNWGY